ncbi:MAG TPA: methyltransferase [Streptosporangiaceae bacterium]|nr:methyltransferase [Streptosporangiaceae bacterium]
MNPSESAPPGAAIWRLLDSCLEIQVVRAFTELRVADHFRGQFREVASLAEATGTQPDRLARLLRAAAALGLCDTDEHGRFALTPEGELLSTGTSDSLAAWALLLTAPWLTRPWGELANAIRSTQIPFAEIHRVSFWDYVSAHPEDGKLFDAAMTSGAADHAQALLCAVDLSSVGTVVDVGGGQGQLLVSLLDRWPHLRAVVADRPEVLVGARDALEHAQLVDRIDIVPTDFFASVPEGGDAYVLSRILHDWPDPEAMSILTTCRRAMGPDARLYILEDVVPSAEEMSAAQRAAVAMKDLNMLVLVGGQERTAREYEGLLASSGFADVRILGDAPLNVIEARPA